MNRKFNKLSRIKYLFYKLDDYKLYKRIKIDDESLRYITPNVYSMEILNIMKQYIDFNEKTTIFDANGGVGGDTITFGKTFNKVYSVEINKERFNYLLNNINVYNLTNVELFNDNSLNVMFELNDINILFLDPPWEPDGINYKFKDKVQLFVDKTPLEDVINNVINSNNFKNSLKLIVLKLPLNYDIEHFKTEVINNNIFVHTIKKMLIVVIKID